MTDLRDCSLRGLSLPRRAYEVSGFSFESDEPFPELAETALPPLARVGLRTCRSAAPSDTHWYHYARMADGRSWPAFGRSVSGACFALDFEGACTFLISEQGDRIDGGPTAGTSTEIARRLFLDQVIPLVLNLHGRECLHASAVLIGGGAHAFIGPSGAGKSTLAAALAGPTRPLLSDDCLALGVDPGGVLAYPGNRGSKLWPDSAEALCGDAGSLGSVAGHDSKKLLERETVPPRSAPLRRIYLLDAGPQHIPSSVSEGRPSEALPVLLEAAFRLDLTDGEMLARQFRFLAQVISSVPVRRVRYSHDFGLLPSVISMILADAEAN